MNFFLAAHCFLKTDPNKTESQLEETYEVELGRWKTDKRIDCEDENDYDNCEPFIAIPISKIIMHSEYKHDSKTIDEAKIAFSKHDIAIAKLSWKITFSNLIQPIALPIKNMTMTVIEFSAFGNLLIVL